MERGGKGREREKKKEAIFLLSTREEREKGIVDESRQQERVREEKKRDMQSINTKKKRGYSDIMPPKIVPKPNQSAGMQRNTIS